MTRSVKEELARVSDLLDGTQTDVISFFDEVQFLMMVVVEMVVMMMTMVMMMVVVVVMMIIEQ